MAEHSYPFDSGTVDESTWSRMSRVWGGTGVIGYPGDSTAQVFADSSGMQVKVRAGQAQVRGHHWHSDAEMTKVIASNASGNPRIDRVVLWLDPTANSLTVGVVTGTPGASPVPPSLTQTDTGNHAMPLALVYVANGASTISSGNVTDERSYIPDRGVPTGTVLSTLAASAPAGFLLLDGSTVSRSTYAQLFAVIGTVGGAGDGSTTFKLPDLRGRVPVGRDSAQTEFDALGEVGGAKTHTLTEAQMPSHTHGASAASNTVPGQFTETNGGSSSGSFRTGQSSSSTTRAINDSHHAHTITIASAGSGQAHNNLQPYIVTNFIIKT